MNKTDLVKTNTIEGQDVITINSREVAEMLGKKHEVLMKDIQGSGKNLGIIPVLEKGNFLVSNYFIESSYKSGNRNYKCYEVTKMGCELLGNKQQGAKGIAFSAKYVERFNQMEKEIAMKQFNLPTTYKEALLALVQAEEEKELLIAENIKQKEIIELQAPKINLYNDFMNTDNVYSVNDIAKCLAIKNFGRNNLYKYLRYNKILIDETREAYQSHINAGRIVHRIIKYKKPIYNTSFDYFGNVIKTLVETKYEKDTVAYFTPKGIEWLYNKLIKDNYIVSKSLEELMNDLIAESNSNEFLN